MDRDAPALKGEELLTMDTTLLTARKILTTLSAGLKGNFTARLCEGRLWEHGALGPARFTLVLHHPGTLRAMFWPFNEVSFSEAYIFSDFDVEGDFFALFGWVQYLLDTTMHWRPWKKIQML